VRHPEATDEVREVAALYALRVLAAEEAAGFEAHLAEGCRTCERELRAFTAAAGLLGAAAAAVSPPPSVRERLLGRLAEESAWRIVRADEGTWQRGPAEGTWVKPLFRDPVEGRVTVLGRLEPGARYPDRPRSDAEEVFVLDGHLEVRGQTLGPRDYGAVPAMGTLGDLASAAGTSFLLCSSERADQPARGEARPDPLFVPAAEGQWRDTSVPGVSMRRLFRDRRGAITALVRMTPGARLPGHRHRTAEQFYMLEGDAHVAGQLLRAGDYHRAPRATAHEPSHTERGCTFLLIASHLELLDPHR
jgi:quercetin dioxygenase-like cupin family protein